MYLKQLNPPADSPVSVRTTGVTVTLRAEVMKTEQPIRKKIMKPVTLCSLMPRNFGCSPGAAHSDSSFRLLTWEMESTVAATNHGRPMMEHTPSITPTTSRSRWYPQPFCNQHTKPTRGEKVYQPAALSGTNPSVSTVRHPDLQLVLFPVDDDRGDLLVHEDEDGAEQSGDSGSQQSPPGVRSQRGDEPPSSVWRGLNRHTAELEPHPTTSYTVNNITDQPVMSQVLPQSGRVRWVWVKELPPDNPLTPWSWWSKRRQSHWWSIEPAHKHSHQHFLSARILSTQLKVIILNQIWLIECLYFTSFLTSSPVITSCLRKKIKLQEKIVISEEFKSQLDPSVFLLTRCSNLLNFSEDPKVSKQTNRDLDLNI